MRPGRRSPIVLVALAVVVALAAAGCSSSTSKSTAATTTTSAPQPPSAPYAKDGPFAVGYTKLRLAGKRPVFVWYPAAAGASAGRIRETIDIAGFLSPALQAKIPPSARPLYRANAYENAPAQPAGGGYPLVVFSHGFAGYPEQSVSLTTHLASWGFVVAAPDHVERSLDGLLGISARGVPPQSDTAVLQATINLLTNASAKAGLLHGLVAKGKIVAAGHSAGANAAYRLASVDPRVKAWISYAPGFGGQAGAAPRTPTKPGMVMLGTTDGIVPPASSEQLYDRMHFPKYLVKIAKAGHLVFSDICLIGRSQGGIVAIARSIHLGLPESLLKLGSDGCTRDHPLPERAFPAIDQLSVAFFRSALGIDKTPVGLDTSAVANLGADVTVEHSG